jgi:alpha-tubulin suppressor-like RCC1 family protein
MSATVYYTTDGSVPTYPATGSTQVYSGPISVGSSLTLRYFGVSLAGTQETVKSQSYTINLPPVTTASPLGGTYTSVQSVTLTPNMSATIYYTTDGSVPTYPATGSTQVYSGPISVGTSLTIRYFGVSLAGTQETVKSQVYTINLPPVTTASPLGGTYTTVQNVTLTSSKPGNIYYTVDGSTPTFPLSGTTQVYSAPIVISSTTTLRYFAIDLGGQRETLKSQVYTINFAPTTTATPAGGNYTSAQTVTLTADMPATIYFTVDGSLPTFPVTGTTQVYTAPIIIRDSTTLQYFGVSLSSAQEAVRTQVYTIPVYNLSVTVSGGAGNAVHSSPAPDINCTGGTCNQGYSSGTLVQLTPSPAVTDVFVGWSGACSGKAPCTVTMGGARSVTATFVPIALAPTSPKVAGGSMHSVALKTDGTVWTWGYNNNGQLGNGSFSASSTPVQVTDLSQVTAIAAGTYHTVALKNDGTVWTWGYNSSGQLGNGSTTARNRPVQVNGLPNIAAIAAGTDHTVALGYDGTVWTWGDNSAGQLGTGNTTDSGIPVQVAGLSGITAIAAGWHHTITIKTDGTVWSWGDNGSGQLGNGTITGSSSPVKVSNLTDVTSIAGGGYHSVALTSTGTVWSWGENSKGQLGNSTVTNSSVPVAATGLTGVTAISAGAYHSVALKSDTTVWSWGNDSTIGHPSNGTVNSAWPVQMAGLNGITAIGAGYNHTVAIKSDGTGWAWGYNLAGQLGNATASISSSKPVPVYGINLDAAACYAKTGGICYGTIGEAYDAIPLNTTATILVLNRTYIETLNNRRNVAVTLEGGYDSTFSSVIGNTTLQVNSFEFLSGSVALGNGLSVTVGP